MKLGASAVATKAATTKTSENEGRPRKGKKGNSPAVTRLTAVSVTIRSRAMRVGASSNLNQSKVTPKLYTSTMH